MFMFAVGPALLLVIGFFAAAVFGAWRLLGWVMRRRDIKRIRRGEKPIHYLKPHEWKGRYCKYYRDAKNLLKDGSPYGWL